MTILEQAHRLGRALIELGTRSPEEGLISLSPQFVHEQHETYVRLILGAIAAPRPQVPRNLAVTGHYGSGKSSVLVEVERRLGAQAMNLALSSLGADATKLGRVGDGGKPSAMTNLIQKEIIKQLLYRERPARMRGSHYPRIDQFRILPAAGWALVVAAMVAVTLVLGGLEGRVREVFTSLLPARDEWLPWAAIVVLSLSAGAVTFAIQRALHGRLRIEKLSAGPAAVSLTNAGNTYFDEYLDEIVFYFQRSGVKVVIFEDLDRFNDPHIFETLRELNTVLNNSKQIKQKPITFVYAIRDSIFQLLEENEQATVGPEGADVEYDVSIDAAHAVAANSRYQSSVTSRTKFFDLVVPIVPFLSHRTARDQLRNVFTSLPSAPAGAVMDLVAHHLTDMRLIKNIRNEYQVFADRILPPRGKADLDPDRLFAMIVYKNVEMRDFEDIREGNGRIDRVYKAYRRLVTVHAARCDRDIRAARIRLANIDSAGPRAAKYGPRLRIVLQSLASVVGQNWRNTTQIFANGAGFVVDDASKEEFWKSVTAGGGISVPQWSNRSIDTASLSSLLGLSLEPEDWQEARREEFELEIQRAQELKEFVTHASIQQMISRTDLTLPYREHAGLEVSLAAIARQELIPLAVDLMGAEEGYIDQNYTLYVADFQGVYVSAAAMNFILQAVQPDRMDIRYLFESPDDIDVVIAEEGNRFLRGLSVRNIEVFDHLLSKSPSDLGPAVVRLGVESSDEARDFLDAYVEGGKYPANLVGLLAPHFSRVFEYIASIDGLPGDLATRLLDAAFEGADPDTLYEVDDTVRARVKAAYPELRVFTSDEHAARASATGQLAEQLGVIFDDLTPLASKQRDEVVRRRLYPITLNNLRASVGGNSSLALDFIMPANPPVYEHSIANLDDYIAALSEFNLPTIGSQADFARVLADVLLSHPESVAEVARLAAPDCSIEELSDIDSAAWPALADVSRLTATVGNAVAYVESYGVDEHFAQFLRTITAFSNPTSRDETTRRGLAVALANSALLAPSARVELVKSLQLEARLDPATITASALDALPDLVAGGVVQDSAVTFARVAAGSWALKERLFAASSSVASFIGELALSTDDVHDIFESQLVPDSVRAAVCENLDSFLPDLGAAQAGKIAKWATERVHAISPTHLVALHRAGATTDDILAALAVGLADIDLDAIRVVTDDLGEPFSELTSIGDRRVKTVPASATSEALLERLRELGTVSTYKRTGVIAQQFEVHMKRVPG